MNPILHVMVIGFDHKKGSQIDFCYPPLVETVEPKAEDIPPEWENLPTLAIPDLAHTVLEDVIYFLLPSRESPNRSVFGISCYRQINANDLISKDDQVTRSHVQKSVCVVMRIPLYGFLKAKLELITQAYFNERDFSKVMFEIFPVNILGDVMMGLISLFPALLEEGLFEAASYSVRRFCSPSNLACEESHDNNDVRENEQFQLNTHDSKISPDDIRIKIQDAVEVGQDIAATTTGDSSSNHNNPSSFNTNEYGFPLSIFTKGSLFHPYLSINQLDLIRSDNTRAYCIGVTNAIFKQRREFIDVIVSINEQKEGQIEILNPELRQQLSLSTQDLRFMNFILKIYDQNNDPAFWEGSDEWVRSQFHAYLTSLLAVTKSGTDEKISEFNEQFIIALKTKHNYRVWSSQEHSGFAQVTPVHMFSGQFSGNDVLLRVGHSDSGRKMISTLTNTGKLVSQTGNRLKSSISSWMQRSDSNNKLSNETSID